jgi:hypothetical protein
MPWAFSISHFDVEAEAWIVDADVFRALGVRCHERRRYAYAASHPVRRAGTPAGRQV